MVNFFYLSYYFNIYNLNYNLFIEKNKTLDFFKHKNLQIKKKKYKFELKKHFLLNNKYFFKTIFKKYKFKYFNYLLFFKKHRALKYKFSARYINKIFAFWPIFKKKNFYNSWIKKFFKKKLKTNIFKKKIVPIKTKKKSYFFNFHRRLIKIFWKSQIHFKNNFLKKKRFTTRKFKNKFLHWYKKNKKNKVNTINKIISYATQNFLFLSKNCLLKVKKFKILLKNGGYNYSNDSIININDIISFPLNYINFVYDYIIGKFILLKRLKKKNFIFFKNKTSQWKNLKKKPTPELNYLLYSFNKISSTIEYDIFSSNLVTIKNTNMFDIRFNKIIRHNLEKLNVYKLNV